MKRIIFLLIAALFVSNVSGQGITDGLRYATDATLGSARFTAMSGAFGALGGDLSSVAFNPAGSAVFITNDMSVSLGVLDRQNDAVYFNTLGRAIDTDVSINQAGAVFLFDNSDEASRWKKFSVAINYNNTGNLDDDLFIQGRGNRSIGDFFVSRAQGIPLNLLELRGRSLANQYIFLGETEGTAAQDALLGYQGFIIDPVDPQNSGNTAYTSAIAPGRFNQESFRSARGYNGKYTINFAAQYTDDIYFGINLNTHSIDYVESSYFYETNSNSGSTVNEVGFENNLSVIGSGFSAQAGIIAKISNEFRIGLTYDTPTWFVISEETTQYLETNRTEDGQTITEIVNPNVLNVFGDYKLRTPGRYAASAAYVFGKQGLISVDYSYRDFGQMEFDSNFGNEFDPLNSVISTNLTGASSIRIGGEYRINELSLRGGFQYEQSPYEDANILGDRTGFSAGIGYDFGNYNFDVAYARSQQDRSQQLFNQGLTSTADVQTTFSNVVFTLGFSL